MTTYAQEEAARDAAKAKRSRKYRYDPVLFDRVQGTAVEPGQIVVKVQPYGCPKNGTMGMCYVGEAETGKFLGMVCLGSLTPVTKAGGR